MSDQGVWFKLWCSACTDSDLDALDIADFGRWAKFGAHVKKHGTAGSLALNPPERVLCAMLQVGTFEELLTRLTRLPSVTVTGETNATVTFTNWQRYQGDNSNHRVSQFRRRETVKKRREEKRRDEKRRDNPLQPPKGAETEADGFEAFWHHYPRKVAKADALKAWAQVAKARPPLAELLPRLEAAVASRDWRKDGGKFIPYPASWLRGKRWTDEPEVAERFDPSGQEAGRPEQTGCVCHQECGEASKLRIFCRGQHPFTCDQHTGREAR